MSAIPPGSVPTENASGTATTGNAGQGATTEQLMAMVGALAASVHTVTGQLASLTENVSKLQDATSSNFQTNVIGAYDPYDAHRRMHMRLAEIDAVSTKALAVMVSHGEDVLARSLDHFGALPPIAPRSATGPGTSGA